MISLKERIRLAPLSAFISLGVILSLAYWFMAGNPSEINKDQNASLRTQIAETDKKIKEIEVTFSSKAKFQEEMEKVSITFKLALDYLPKELNVQDLLKKIYLEARTAGVELSNFVPREAQSKDFYDEVPMDIELKGSYVQIVKFISNVSKLSRIVNVLDVTLTDPKVSEGVTIMSMKGTLVAYRYKEPPK
jgi:type IV pilus assembly protein PilO